MEAQISDVRYAVRGLAKRPIEPLVALRYE